VVGFDIVAGDIDPVSVHFAKLPARDRLAAFSGIGQRRDRGGRVACFEVVDPDVKGLLGAGEALRRDLRGDVWRRTVQREPGRRHKSQNAEGGERGDYATGKASDGPAQTFARRQGPDKTPLDRGMNLAPADVEHVDTERHWAPSDAWAGHRLRRTLGTAASSASNRGPSTLASTCGRKFSPSGKGRPPSTYPTAVKVKKLCVLDIDTAHTQPEQPRPFTCRT
jgi:hypothetical protein